MINYKHLHYFWVAAKQGGIARASERLHLTPQTISGQISMLEEQLGETLFRKAGRSLELTETGRLVLSYADEIFSLGGELEDAVRNLPSTRPLVFKVGVADVDGPAGRRGDGGGCFVHTPILPGPSPRVKYRLCDVCHTGCAARHTRRRASPGPDRPRCGSWSSGCGPLGR